MDVTEVEVVVGMPDVEAEVAAEVMVGTVVEEQDKVHGRDSRGGTGQGTSDDASGINSLGCKSYSPQEWQNLSAAQRQEVYRQWERLATARTVAEVITESLNTGNGDDISAITTPTSHGATNNQVNNQTQERVGV